MFKSWRSDKKKIRAVFKLQFKATQVPQLKKPALIISLVPEDVGKTTFKLEKAAVKDGTCLWEHPIFVTVKLIKHQKTGKLDEKIYHFVVSSGSSKSGYLGEASIDFADFAEETQPLTVSLPLKFANSGAVLLVTVQRVQGDVDQRYIEDEGDSLSQDESLKNRLSIGHTVVNDYNFTEDPDWENLLSENTNEDGSFKASSDAKSTSRQNSMPQNNSTTKNRLHRSSTDWSMGSASDGSLVDSRNSPDNSFPREMPGASDECIEKLRNEIMSLKRQAELSDLELQSLRKQITKENRRAQDLLREMIELKEERDAIKSECVQLRSQQKYVDGEAMNRLRADNKEIKVQLEEIKQELSHEKDLNNNLKVQLQKTQDTNSELILAVNELDEMLEQKKLEISHLSVKHELNKSIEEVQCKKCKCNMREDEDQPAAAVHGMEELAREQNDAIELSSMKQMISDLNDEIEGYREDREKLENYIDKLTQDYADLEQKNLDISSKLKQHQLEEIKMKNESTEYLAIIEDLESQIQKLEEKLQEQTREFAESLDSINELESQVKALEIELEKQAQGFENDLNAMTSAKIEQEQRAMRAEENLRKTRWKNAITAERLKEEFRRLSVEMAGKFDENEKLMTKSKEEANELRVQNGILEERLRKANEELSLIRDQSRVKEEELSSQLDLKRKHLEQVSMEQKLEVQMLKAKIELLTKENNDFSEEAKKVKSRDAAEQAKTSVEETGQLIKRWNTEREELERNFALTKKEAEKAQKELLILKSFKNEKEIMVQKLSSEAESLRTQHTELKTSLSKEETVKKHLKQQLDELKHELKKRKEERSSSIQKELKSNNGQAIPTEVSITSTRDDCNHTELLAEMAWVKERNKSMESDLKDMQERYSEISLKFAEVEGERQQLVMTVRNLKSGKKN